MDKRLNSLELLGEAMDMKSIVWRYSVKRRHIFEKSRKAKEMKANEIYSLRQNSGESKTEIHTSRYCIYTQNDSRV